PLYDHGLRNFESGDASVALVIRCHASSSQIALGSPAVHASASRRTRNPGSSGSANVTAHSPTAAHANATGWQKQVIASNTASRIIVPALIAFRFNHQYRSVTSIIATPNMKLACPCTSVCSIEQKPARTPARWAPRQPATLVCSRNAATATPMNDSVSRSRSATHAGATYINPTSSQCPAKFGAGNLSTVNQRAN